MSAGSVVSQVRYMYQPGGPISGPCGYCHGEYPRFCVDGVWAEKISAQDFQELIDRGCQRSGQYIYQPCNWLTCCPQYILRLDVSTFRVSKSQRRVVRRVNEYLKTGQQPTKCEREEEGVASTSQVADHEAVKVAKDEPRIKKKHVTPGKGADPSKPPPRKAKELRRERKELKLAASGERMETSIKQVSKKCPVPHNLIELVRLPDSQECQHKLEVKLICTNPVSKEFWDSYTESYEVFRKFQMVIHKEPEYKCGESQYMQFIVDSPLFPEESPPGTGLKYGSYHQQYWLDNKLIMIGVLDIIPKGVLCNYLYYDPDVRFLAPGVYSALREIAFNQELYQCNPSLQYYYMGYYVHDCPKMNYKRHYDSTYILCSESLVYVPLERARVKLDEMMTKKNDDKTLSKHCRLVDEMPPQESYSEEDRNKVLVSCSQGKVMEYGSYRGMYGERHDELVSAYLTMVGRVCAPRMQLHLVTYGF